MKKNNGNGTDVDARVKRHFEVYYEVYSYTKDRPFPATFETLGEASVFFKEELRTYGAATIIRNNKEILEITHRTVISCK